MSKNFAEEYKTLANEELPDLWNRIEAGLTPKATSQAGEEHSPDMEQTIKSADSGASQVAELEKEKEKGKVISFLFRYRTVVAAAVCVIMILPAVILLGRNNRSKSFSGSAADMAAETREEALADDAADMESEEMYLMESDDAAEAPAEEPEAKAGGAGFDNGSDGAGASAETALIEDLDSEGAAEKKMDQQENRNVKEAVSDEAADITEDIAEEEKALPETQRADQSFSSTTNREAKIFERVTVEAAEQTGENVKIDGDFFYGINMKVIEDPSGELTEDTEITVWVSYLSSVAYVQGQEYVLDLSYDPGRECPYQVKKNYFS